MVEVVVVVEVDNDAVAAVSAGDLDEDDVVVAEEVDEDGGDACELEVAVVVTAAWELGMVVVVVRMAAVVSSDELSANDVSVKSTVLGSGSAEAGCVFKKAIVVSAIVSSSSVSSRPAYVVPKSLYFYLCKFVMPKTDVCLKPSTHF